MFITTHAAIGALIGEAIPTHPILAFILGFASHLLIDIVPHGDSNLYKGYISGSKTKRAVAYVMIDAVVALFLVLFLFNTKVFDHRFSVSMGIAGGVLPDLLVAFYELYRVKGFRWFHRVHFFFHNLITRRTGDLSFPIGFGMQVLFLAILLTRLG